MNLTCQKDVTSVCLSDRKLLPHWVLALLIFQAGLLGYRALSESYCWDEVAHLPSGLSHIEFGTFDLYRVNPPLVRTIAAIGPWMAGYKSDWRQYSARPESRAEFEVGRDFLLRNGERSFWLLKLARFCVLWIIPIGGWFAWRWSTLMFGDGSGALTLWLWVFSPSLMTAGSLITPDAVAASFGLMCMYFAWQWSRFPNRKTWFRCGLGLGLAVLSKTTLILLVPVIIILAILNYMYNRRKVVKDWKSYWFQLVLILFMGGFLLNLGYNFTNSFTPLNEYTFISRAMTGDERPAETSLVSTGNRFRESWLGRIPIPFPKNWLMGIDVQRWDFECRPMSFLAGEWKRGGWWYYYLYGWAVKEPLGVWILASVTVSGILFNFFRRTKTTFCGINECGCVVLPILAIFCVVSSQTGINHHLRYVLPALPFVYVLAGASAEFLKLHPCSRWLGGGLCLWIASSSLSVYPHSTAYFNESVGGPANGYKHMLSSNLDWGQDLLNLKHWYDRHAEARPFYFEYVLPIVDPETAGIKSMPIPTRQEIMKLLSNTSTLQGASKPLKSLAPGWYAISVGKLQSSEDYSWLKSVKPIGHIGWSIFLYHLDESTIAKIKTQIQGLDEN